MKISIRKQRLGRGLILGRRQVVDVPVTGRTSTIVGESAVVGNGSDVGDKVGTTTTTCDRFRVVTGGRVCYVHILWGGDTRTRPSQINNIIICELQ